MKTVAIVCEYNPFHSGHKHQIEVIKRELGEDTAIVAIMSGNYVQRGDLALLGKFSRARMAVDAGVSLVLELPFPFSLGSAERFASAAVEIAHKLGAVDILSFGSECGSVEELKRTADRLLEPSFDAAVKSLLNQKGNESLGYAKARSEAYLSLYGKENAELLLSPNNILAIEYLKALRSLSSSIHPHTVLRAGTDKDGATDKAYAGATFIRALFFSGKENEALTSIPSESWDALLEAQKQGEMPASINRISPLILSSLREAKAEQIAECGGGLYEYLSGNAKKVGSIEEFFDSASTKKYTDARIRRASLFSYFGVTPAILNEELLYTQVLAMDGKGQAVLHHIKKTADIAIVSKPADLRKLSPEAKAQAERAYRADSVYALSLPTPRAADYFLRISPYRK